MSEPQSYLGDVIGEPMVRPRHVTFRSPSHRLCHIQRGVHVVLGTVAGIVITGLVVIHLAALFWYAPARILAVE